MKGIVFTELIKMIDKNFGAEMVDDIFDDCSLESGGAYTTVGTYNHTELLEIVNSLSKKTGVPTKELIQEYGYYLFSRFHDLMPHFFEGRQSAFDFLESVHDYVHVEVKKLYPDASLPQFETDRQKNDKMTMVYTSKCPFADFAEGLMKGCINHFNEDIDVETEDQDTKDKYVRVFTLRKH